MASLNEATLIGNLCADPETRSMSNGGEVVNLRIATNETWKDKDGNRQERAEYHNVVIFNEKIGGVAKSYLRKGSKVFVRGALQTRRWTDQSGADKYSTEVVLQRFRGELVLLDSRGGDGQSYNGDPQTNSSGSVSQRPAPAFDTDLDDDVPF